MKRSLIISSCIALLLPCTTIAADLGINGTTIIRIEERSVPGYAKETIVPATQFFGIDADKIGNDHLSFHLYGWGRADLADRSTTTGTTDGNLTYAYLEYHFNRSDGNIRAGRFFVYEGVANDQIDGISARADLNKGFAVSFYGGAPVKLHNADIIKRTGDDNKGDFIVGGRLSYRTAGFLELGVSALHEGGAETRELLDPVAGTFRTLKDYREMVGGDIWLSPFRMVELNGHTFYNTAAQGVAEHSYMLTVRPAKTFYLSLDYNEQHFKEYFAATSIPSLFKPDERDTMKSYGAIVTYDITKPLEFSLYYKHYDRKTMGNSDRFGAEMRMYFKENTIRSGLSYFRVEAAKDINSFHEVRGYLLYDKDKIFSSFDAIADIYDTSIYNKTTAFEMIGSAGYRFFPNLALSGDISYSQTPQLQDDIKGVVRLTFNYSYIGKGAGK